MSRMEAKKLTFEHTASMLMAAICGGGSIYNYYTKTRSMPMLFAGMTLGSLYGLSSYWIRGGRALDGVDLSIVASTMLLIAMGPRAYSTGGGMPMALSGLGAIVLARMGFVSYGLRHGAIAPVTKHP